MIHKMYGVFDTASGVYDRPFVAISHGQALRSFGDIAVAADHPIGQHPEDFSLVYLADYDDNTGEIKPVARQTLITGMEAVAEAQGKRAMRVVDNKGEK